MNGDLLAFRCSAKGEITNNPSKKGKKSHNEILLLVGCYRWRWRSATIISEANFAKNQEIMIKKPHQNQQEWAEAEGAGESHALPRRGRGADPPRHLQVWVIIGGLATKE